MLTTQFFGFLNFYFILLYFILFLPLTGKHQQCLVHLLHLPFLLVVPSSTCLFPPSPPRSDPLSPPVSLPTHSGTSPEVPSEFHWHTPTRSQIGKAQSPVLLNWAHQINDCIWRRCGIPQRKTRTNISSQSIRKMSRY